MRIYTLALRKGWMLADLFDPIEGLDHVRLLLALGFQVRGGGVFCFSGPLCELPLIHI